MARKRNPFADWAKTAKFNGRVPMLPGDYPRCWHAALCRLSVVLNYKSSPHDLPLSLLAKDDDALVKHFRKLAKPQFYFSIVVQTIDQSLLKEAIDKEDIATNFFYGTFAYPKGPTHSGRTLQRRIIYHLTETFLDYSYRGLHLPRRQDGAEYTVADLGKSDRVFPGKIMKQCATNYLVRNFWHNITHDLCQNITNTNFDDFRGRARYDSDFEADSLSLILLAYSYGLPITADDTNGTRPNDRIVYILRQNRCNELFRLRANDRKGFASNDESEFRICRTIAGYLSGWLLAQGLATAAITVHAIGYVMTKPKGYYRAGEGFAISLNGYRIAYPTPYPTSGNDADRSRYLRDLATSVQAQYQTAMRKSSDLKNYARTSLRAALGRLGI